MRPAGRSAPPVEKDGVEAQDETQGQARSSSPYRPRLPILDGERRQGRDRRPRRLHGVHGLHFDDRAITRQGDARVAASRAVGELDVRRSRSGD